MLLLIYEAVNNGVVTEQMNNLNNILVICQSDLLLVRQFFLIVLEKNISPYTRLTSVNF